MMLAGRDRIPRDKDFASGTDVTMMTTTVTAAMTAMRRTKFV